MNIYVEKIFQLAQQNEKGIKINEMPINNLRYADETVIITDNIEELQEIVNNLNRVVEEVGLSINILYDPS